MKANFYVKEVYGKPLIYPTGPATAHVRALTGRLTVYQKEIDVLIQLGVECEFVRNSEHQKFDLGPKK